MTEFFEDPRFPDRPKHPDYDRLTGVIAYLDGETTEGGRDASAVAAQYIDPESLSYMALHRARRFSQMTGLPVPQLAAMYMDAFCAGVMFEKEGGHRV